MPFEQLNPEHWLTDAHLTNQGREARAAYECFCGYLDQLNILSFQAARAKYFLQSTQYWTLPGGYALPPHTVNVCVNNICNMHCRYCDFGQGQSQTFYHKYNVVASGERVELSLDTMKSIVDQVRWFRPIIRASFREPLMHKDILPFIEYTKRVGLPFWLLTNGFKLPDLASDLARLQVDSIRLSLDGPPKVHNQIRGMKNAAERMMAGVHRLLDERRIHAPAMQVGFYFTLNDLNSQHILPTVEYLAQEGLLKEVFVNFQWLLFTTREMAEEHNRTDALICGGQIQESTVQNVDFSLIDPRTVYEQYQEVQRRFPSTQGYRIHFRPSFELNDLIIYRNTRSFPLDAPRCKTPWYNLNINPAGEVKSFHHCLLSPAGNIHHESPLDVWNGGLFREQRQLLKQHGAYRGCARCWGLYSLVEDRRRKD